MPLRKRSHLSAYFIPNKYELDLRIVEANKYDGYVIIHGKKLGRPSKRLVVYFSGHRILGANLSRKDKNGETPVDISRINQHARYQELRIHAGSILYPGEYVIRINFGGKIDSQTKQRFNTVLRIQNDHESLLEYISNNKVRDIFPCVDC